ncbi:phosphotransferase [Sphingomonas solaris]|uniref:Phosphotransferase n=1 Tax=Alterirhizorhabdus solaris TaxID=2529389 RepID=A0A558RCQ0_9SPHN|nr:phosphotransferase [Sphingomonas solaris]TVV77128.1 phosphotransferase [Sphingomonas solaris]
MSDTAGTPDYDDAAVARLRGFVEEIAGGRIVRMERQVRWRPAWFVDVERADGTPLHLHLRGDRSGDVAIFPELKREADIQRILADHGIPVPKVHGFCADPPCTVMDAIGGTRDFSGLDRAEKSAVGRSFMQAVAAMHALPTAPFEAVGVERPEGAEAIALVGLEAYLPHYRRTKSRPEPLLEFVIGWLRRNVPTHRTAATYIQFDSGQFLVEDGKMTGLYDFEFSMIGDPMTDIATIGMRDSYEPLGAPLAELVRYYEEASGEPVDHQAILFHVLQFSTLGTMQFTGTVGAPKPGDPHAVYLQFDLALRRSIVLALSALSGVALPDLPPLPEQPGGNSPLIAKLVDTLAGVRPLEPIDAAQKVQATELAEWISRIDRHGAVVSAADSADVVAYLGEDADDWPAALEARVLAAGPAEDAALIRLLAAIEGRRLQMFGPTAIGAAAMAVVLPKTR